MCEPEGKPVSVGSADDAAGASKSSGSADNEAPSDTGKPVSEHKWDANLLKAKHSEIKEQISEAAPASKEGAIAASEASAPPDKPEPPEEQAAGSSGAEQLATSSAVKTEEQEAMLANDAEQPEHTEGAAPAANNELQDGGSERDYQVPVARHPRLQLRLLTQRDWLFASRHVPRSTLHRASILNSDLDVPTSELERQLDRAEKRLDRAQSEYQVLHTAAKL